MPRSNGIYTPPSGTAATTQTTISSAAYNAFVNDIATDQNNPRPIIAGGTGAATAAQARANLGAIGLSEVQNAIPEAIQSAASKATPVDADSVPLVDSADDNKLKRLTWANLKAALGSAFLSLTGGTLTGKLTLKASATGSASLNIPDGAAPTSPANGDIWVADDALIARLGGSSRTIYHNGNLPAASQAHAEGGTDTTLLAWSALRIAQLVGANVPVGLYTGTSLTNTNFPVGHHVLTYNDTADVKANQSSPIYVTSNGIYTRNSSAATLLSGTWRSRGMASGSTWSNFMQRTA